MVPAEIDFDPLCVIKDHKVQTYDVDRLSGATNRDGSFPRLAGHPEDRLTRGAFLVSPTGLGSVASEGGPDLAKALEVNAIAIRLLPT